MLSSEFDYNAVIDSDNFAIKHFKDAVYKGEIEADTNKRHGKGVIIYKNGRVYEGDWIDDKRQGRGSFALR